MRREVRIKSYGRRGTINRLTIRKVVRRVFADSPIIKVAKKKSPAKKSSRKKS